MLDSIFWPKGLVKEIINHDTYELRDFPINSFSHIIDIGANVGIFSTFARMLQPRSKIIAIEPGKKAYEALTKISPPLSIYTDNIALGNGKKLGLMPRHSWSENMFLEDHDGLYNIESLTLPDIFTKYNITTEHKYFLKIDCEGGERYLIDDNESEKLISSSLQLSIEIHFPCPKRPHFSCFPSFKTYETWFNKFDNSHLVRCKGISKRGGIAFFVLKKLGI